jgi:hypothetical protein
MWAEPSEARWSGQEI